MIKIVPAKKYVKMEYFPAHSKQQMIQRFEQETRRETGNEFVECLAFSGETGVVMTGNQTEEAEPDKVGPIRACSISSLESGVVMTGNQTDKVGTNQRVSGILWRDWGQSGVVMTGNQTEEAEPDKVGTNQRVSGILLRNWGSYDREPDRGGGA